MNTSSNQPWRGHLALGSLLSAGCIVLASPGGPLPWLMPVAFVPFFAVVGGSHLSAWARLGGTAVTAGAWSAPIAAGLVLRAPLLGLGLAAGTASVLAACLFVAARPGLTPWMRLGLFSAVWGSAAGLLETASSHIRPWPLAGALSLAYPEAWPIVALGGWPLLDTVLFGPVVVSWGVIAGCIRMRGLELAAFVGTIVVFGSTLANDGLRMVGTASIGVVQGNIARALLHNARLSPNDRAIVRARLLEGTDRVLRAGARLVIWPENGMGLPTGQIPSLTQPLVLRAKRYQAQILATGDEWLPEGPRPVGWLLGDGLEAVVRKSEHVPGLEAHESLSDPTVILTKEGAIAVLLCYDAVMFRVVRGCPTEKWPERDRSGHPQIGQHQATSVRTSLRHMIMDIA